MRARENFGRTIRAALAAGGADEVRFDVKQPEMIRPAVRAHRNRMRATIVGAIDQHVAHAGGAHVAECDLGLEGRRDIPELKS
jgi:hypothetical protein